MTSPDGSVWTEQLSGMTHHIWYDVTWGGGQFLAVGKSGMIMTSPDGRAWTAQPSGRNDLSYVTWNGVTWGGGQFVAVGNGVGGMIRTSPDGRVWTAQPSGTTRMNGVTWGGGQFVAVSSEKIMTSSDGHVWTASLAGATSSLGGVTWGVDQFVAVGGYGSILTSRCSIGMYPAVTTRFATGITASGATLNGTVNDNGASTTVSFEYGQTTNYGTMVSAVPAILDAGSGDTSVRATLLGLTCSSTYHYRVKASNSIGSTDGTDRSFTTSACPASAPSATTNTSTGVTASGAILNGTVNDNGASTTVSFQYGQTTSYGTTVAATPDTLVAGSGDTAVATTLSGLTCNRIYHYRVKASNSAGAVYGSDLSFTTSACPLSKPSATTDTATGITATGATLNGTVNDNGASTYVTFEIGQTTDYGFDLSAIPETIGAEHGSTMVSKNLTWLACDTTYHYRVKAVNSQGATYGDDLSFKTSACTVTNYPLAVTKSGDGQGNIWSGLGGINCGSDCSVTYPADTPVFLEATAAADSRFVGWAGACIGTRSRCLVTMTAAKDVTAVFKSNDTTCADQWSWANPAPQGNSLFDVAYGDGVFVAVGEAGTLIRSTDGLTWTNHHSSKPSSINSVTWGGGQFVAVGDYFNWDGTYSYGPTPILTSPDGVTWTERDTGTRKGLYDVVWNGTQFVAVGSNAILTSPDGVTWTTRSLDGTDSQLNGVAWSGSEFVAVGTGGAILTSSDGITWIARDSGSSIWLNGVVWGNDRFVAVGEAATILTSPDGVTWTEQPYLSLDTLYDVAWDGSQFFVAAGNIFLTSPDGVSWIARNTAGTAAIYGLSWSGSQFVAVGWSGRITTSSDGFDWTESTFGTSQDVADIAWNGSQFAAVGDAGTILTSPDGMTWTARSSGTSKSLLGIAWGADRFAAVGESGAILTSPDGSRWTSQASGVGPLLYDVTWSASQFVSVGSGGTIVTSPDGIDWTIRDSGTTETLRGVASDGNQLVAVGYSSNSESGTILTSQDGGVTWTSRSSAATALLSGVTWGGDQFVAVGGPRIFTSPDGVTWTERVSGTNASLLGISWDGSQYLTSGASGTLLTSPDGINWSPRDIMTAKSLRAVAGGEDLHVVVGDKGTILTNRCGDGEIAPVAITHAASNVTSTAARINGTVNDNGASTTVGFEYGLTNSYGNTLSAQPDTLSAGTGSTSVTATLSGLTCNSTYHYRVKASNSAGATDGGDRSFNTSACPGSAPNATTNTATGITATGATLNGTVNDNGENTTISFEYGQTTSYGTTVTATPATLGAGAGSTAVASTLSGLACNSTYHYQVKASNSAGTTDGGDLSFTTSACSPTTYSLSVSKSGSGEGTIVSGDSPPTIDCGSDCTEIYPADTVVTLTATAADDAFFGGWNGACTGTLPTCVVTMDAIKSITASFVETAGTCGLDWQWATTIPTDQPMQSVVSDGGQLVAVGANGSILTSSDGIDWTSRDSGTSNWLKSVAWNGSLFVAVGDSGTILTSADGVAWTAHSLDMVSGLFDVAWGANQFVAVGENVLLRSSDGVSWTESSQPAPWDSNWATYSGVTWDGVQFLVVGIGRAGGGDAIYEPAPILTSPDGAAWTSISSDAGVSFTDVISDGSQFIGVGVNLLTLSGSIVSSPDGVDWTSRYVDTLNQFHGVSWSGNQFVAVGDSGAMLTSPDGWTWTARASGTTNGLHGVTWSGSQFVAVGDAGTILTSSCDGQAVAPSATTTAASSVTGSGATLNGIANDNGASTTVSFEYGQTTSYGNTVSSVPETLDAGSGDTAVSVTLSGLTCNRTYHFRVKANNSAGTTDGGDLSLTTSACPAIAPTATTTAATGISTSGATLNGTVKDNGAVTTVGFDYGLTTAYGASVAATPGTVNAGSGDTAVTASLSGLECNRTYHYRVTAANSADTTLGDDLSFLTTSCSSATAGIRVTPTSGLFTTESGGTDTFSVVLESAPSADVSLDLASSDTSEGSVSPASLAFTSANWDQAQTVTVTGVDDSVQDGDIAYSILTSIAASNDTDYQGLDTEDVAVSNSDDDTAGIGITESDGNTQVAENSGSDSFRVVLDSQPLGNVILLVSSPDTGEATVNPASLTFTSDDWDQPQEVTVTGVDDALIDGNRITQVAIQVDTDNSDASYAGLGIRQVAIETLDDDTADFTVAESDGGTQVSESGSSDTLTVVLNAEPDSDVVIAVASSDSAEADVSPTRVTFTPANWNAPQTITVTGVDDALIDGNQTRILTFSVEAGSDPNFVGLEDYEVSVTTTDDDTAGFTASETDGDTLVDENGTTDLIDVVLNARPSTDVRIEIVSADTGEAIVTPAFLDFTSANWNQVQSVTVTGADDGLVDGDQDILLTFAIAASSDGDFLGVADQEITVTTTDDDSAGITLTETGGTTQVGEDGSTDTFDVVLNADPATNVVIRIASADTGEVTASPATLTFTAANWMTPQAVTVTGVDDILVDGNQTTAITLSIDDAQSDDVYDGLPDKTLLVGTTDNDSAGISVSPTSGLETTEAGGSASFGVVLNSEPITNVSVAVRSGDTSEGTVAPSSLVFTPLNWSSPQTVIVTGANDTLVDGDQVYSVELAAAVSADANYDGQNPADVSVTNRDNDYRVTPSAGANGRIDPSSVQAVEDGASTSFTVTPDDGYGASVTGCGGTLSGTTYTTGAITADCAISATFRQGLFSLTVEPGTGDGHYVAGRIVGIAADLPPNGMVFEQWNGDIATLINTRLPNTSLTMPTRSIAVTASYRDKPVERIALTVNAGSGSGEYEAGQIVSVTADAAPEGWIFDQWGGNTATLANARLANTTLTMPTTALNIEAQYRMWLATDFTLNVGRGSGSGRYAAGRQVGIEANSPSATQMFDYWDGDTATLENLWLPETQVTMPAASVSLSAVYRDRPSETFPLTIGTVELSAAQVAAGVQASVARGLMAALRADNEKVAGSWVELETPPTRNGLVFLIWSGQTTNVENPNLPKTRLYMPASAVTVQAVYGPSQGDFVLSVTDGSGGGLHGHGELLAIRANPPSSGYAFDRWEGQTATLADPAASNTTLFMPAYDLSLRALYRATGVPPSTPISVPTLSIWGLLLLGGLLGIFGLRRTMQCGSGG
ncbi:hypothetical protein CCR95_00275 [Thiocystis minor]|nr:hypothetical protein [Thiocystis minor]